MNRLQKLRLNSKTVFICNKQISLQDFNFSEALSSKSTSPYQHWLSSNSSCSSSQKCTIRTNLLLKSHSLTSVLQLCTPIRLKKKDWENWRNKSWLAGKTKSYSLSIVAKWLEKWQINRMRFNLNKQVSFLRQLVEAVFHLKRWARSKWRKEFWWIWSRAPHRSLKDPYLQISTYCLNNSYATWKSRWVRS